MTDDLITWLRAHLDEDEQVARGAMFDQSPPWKAFEGDYGWAVATEIGGIIRDGDYGGDRDTAEHIARWDPARVLAEIDAKRRILDGISMRLHHGEPDGGLTSADAETDGMASATLRLLALPYADRAGYREEWRP